MELLGIKVYTFFEIFSEALRNSIPKGFLDFQLINCGRYRDSVVPIRSNLYVFLVRHLQQVRTVHTENHLPGNE